MQINNQPYPAPTHPMVTRELHVITDEIIHHTAGPLTQTPLDIDAEHRGIGDSMIAYNYIITPDGVIHSGRPVEFVPAAAFGRNLQSIDVCLVGDFEKTSKGYTGRVPDAQHSALIQLSIWLHQHYPTIERTIGHRDVALMFYPGVDESDYATACPGSDLYAIIPDLRLRISEMLKNR